MTNFSIFFLVSLLFAASAAPSALGLVINGATITTVNISGLLSCTVTGNPVPGQTAAGVAGATVRLQCPAAGPTVRQVLTDVSGIFQFLFNTVDFPFNPRNCAVVVDLPVNLRTAVGCTVLPPTGSLIAGLNPVGLIQTILGAVASFVSGIWSPSN